MGRNWTLVGFAMIVVVASAVGAGAEKPPEGLSTPEWWQITSAIQLEQGRRTAEVGSKGTESLYALDQKLGPGPTIPHARFGNSVATDSDPVVGLVDVVYVSRILEGEVVVIDVQTDSVIRLLDTGSNPAEIGIVTILSRAFVADLIAGTVTVVDTGDHSIEGVIDLGVPVATIGVDEAAQRVYALDFSNGVPGTDLHVIDAGTNIEIDAFTVGSRTQNIVVDSVGDLAYITDFDQGVNEVDTGTGVVLRNLPMANLPHGIAFDDVVDRLYVTRLDSDSVAVIDRTTLTVDDVLAVGDLPQWVALDPPRNKAFVTNEGDGTVSVIDTLTNTVHPTAIPVGTGPLTLTIHEGAAKAYVYNVGDGTISVIDTVGETVIATIDVLFADGFESRDTGAWGATSP